MLNRSSELHIPAESEFLRTLHNRRHEYGDFTKEKEIWFFIRDLQYNEVSFGAMTFPIFRLTDEEAFAVVEAASPTDFPGAADALFSASARKAGKSRWADKTPRYVRHIDWLAEAFPGSKFIHMIRDGRAVANSRSKAGFTPSLPLSARHWKREVVQGLESGRKLGSSRYMEVRYESLLNSPESMLREICSWVELSYTGDMLSFHEDPVENVADQHLHLHKKVSQPLDPKRAGGWREEMTNVEIAEVEAEIGDLLQHLSYELTDLRMPLWRRIARSLVSATLPVGIRLRDAIYNMGVTVNKDD